MKYFSSPRHPKSPFFFSVKNSHSGDVFSVHVHPDFPAKQFLLHVLSEYGQARMGLAHPMLSETGSVIHCGDISPDVTVGEMYSKHPQYVCFHLH